MLNRSLVDPATSEYYVTIEHGLAVGRASILARVAGVAWAARKGMLIRSFSAFERAETIDTLVLDKTGTVTRGDWRLQAIIPINGFTPEKALALASGLEQGASHPIALELLREAQERHIRPERADLLDRRIEVLDVTDDLHLLLATEQRLKAFAK